MDDKSITREDALNAINRIWYRWDDGWTACVSCRVIDSKESARLRRKNKGFSGYDWMVRSIIADDRIEHHKNYC